ncbi:MAG: hypothetical protein JNL01_06215 [Bdellovibrionales bacterium]|nr:hypothetical protein [Bdellovibrionales bacterium]
MRLVRPLHAVVLIFSLGAGSPWIYAKDKDPAACLTDGKQVFQTPQAFLDVANYLNEELSEGELAQLNQTPACKFVEKHCDEKCSSYTRKKPKLNCGLTQVEYTMLQYYTGSGYYCLNKGLREKKFKYDDPAIQTLNSALSKLPNYRGFVSRGADLPQEVIRRHQVGSIIEYTSFTSTSTGDGFGGSVKYKIFSKTGKPVMGFSAVGNGELEVLFRAPTRFKVLAVEPENNQMGRGYTLIVMKEVNPGLSPKKEAEEDDRLFAQYQETGGRTANDEWNCPSAKALEYVKILNAVYGDVDITSQVRADFSQNGRILNCVNHYGPKRVVNLDMTVTLEMEVTYQCTTFKGTQKPKKVRLFCNPYDGYFTPQCDST